MKIMELLLKILKYGLYQQNFIKVIVFYLDQVRQATRQLHQPKKWKTNHRLP